MPNVEKKEKAVKPSQTKEALRKAADFLLRWFYLAVIVISSAYAVFIWKKYIMNADWSEEKKKAYISERSVLSFDEERYKKALDIMNGRREKMKSGEKFSGRDIFFPE